MRSKDFANIGSLEAPNAVHYSRDLAWFRYQPYNPVVGRRYKLTVEIYGNGVATATVTGAGVELECSTAMRRWGEGTYTLRAYNNDVLVATWAVEITFRSGKTFNGRTHVCDTAMYGGEGVEVVAPFELTRITTPSGNVYEVAKGQTITLTDEDCEGEVVAESIGFEPEYNWNNGLFFGINASMVLPESDGTLPDMFERSSVKDYFLEPIDGKNKPYMWQVEDGSTFQPLDMYVICEPFSLVAGALQKVELCRFDGDPNNVTMTSAAYVMNGAFADTSGDVATWGTSIRFASDSNPFTIDVEGVEYPNAQLVLLNDNVWVAGLSLTSPVAKVGIGVSGVCRRLMDFFAGEVHLLAYSQFGGYPTGQTVTMSWKSGEETYEVPQDYVECGNRYNCYGVGIVSDAVEYWLGETYKSDAMLGGLSAVINIGNNPYAYTSTLVNGDIMWVESDRAGNMRLCRPSDWVGVAPETLDNLNASNILTYNLAVVLYNGGSLRKVKQGGVNFSALDTDGATWNEFSPIRRGVFPEYLAENSGDIYVMYNGFVTQIATQECPQGIAAEPTEVGELTTAEEWVHRWQVMPAPCDPNDRRIVISYTNTDGCKRVLYGYIIERVTSGEVSTLAWANGDMAYYPLALPTRTKVAYRVAFENLTRNMYADDIVYSDEVSIGDTHCVLDTAEVVADFGDRYTMECIFVTML